mmetsp:Transcript_5999/g.13917  ORF Transcript_5999/g.13917 Transcript_5999/m.13917 type:complete len:339 (+) Transcript_5999:113-1129(+)
MAATPVVIYVGYFSITLMLVCLTLLLLPKSLAASLPKPLKSARKKLLSYASRAVELSKEGPFYRVVIWAGKKFGGGGLASLCQPPVARCKPQGSSEVGVTLTPTLPRNPFHVESYVVSYKQAGREESWREKAVDAENDCEKVTMSGGGGSKLKTFLERLPERTKMEVRACAVNAKGRSPWSGVVEVETMARPNADGGCTEKLECPIDDIKEYMWTQTRTEVFIKLPVPERVKARNIKFKCTGAMISIEIEDGGNTHKILSAPLHKRVRADEVFWTIEESDKHLGRHLSVQMLKAKAIEKWPCFLDRPGQTQIDVGLLRFFTGEPENMSDLTALDGLGY